MEPLPAPDVPGVGFELSQIEESSSSSPSPSKLPRFLPTLGTTAATPLSLPSSPSEREPVEEEEEADDETDDEEESEEVPAAEVEEEEDDEDDGIANRPMTPTLSRRALAEATLVAEGGFWCPLECRDRAETPAEVG